MPRFFVSASDCGAETIVLRGEDAAHISRALRMKPGEELIVCSDDGVEYETSIVSVGKEVEVRVLSSKPSENEPPYRVVVYQALVRGERFDTVLMKATELGAAEIVPVITARCTVKLSPDEYPKKRERWQRIAEEAAKQCGRGLIPAVRSPVKLSEALADAAGVDLPLFCYEGDGTEPIASVCAGREEIATASVVIGPEGGFEPWEADAARGIGMKMTGLGRRILRTETAAPFVLACLSFRYESGRAGF